MYTLLSGLYRHLTQKDDFYVLILGLDNAGKTTFLESAKTKFTQDYKGVNPNKITSTVGLNIGKIDVNGIRLNFWDLGKLTPTISLRNRIIELTFLLRSLKVGKRSCRLCGTSIMLNVMESFTRWIRMIVPGLRSPSGHLTP